MNSTLSALPDPGPAEGGSVGPHVPRASGETRVGDDLGVRAMVQVNGDILIGRPVEEVFDFVANQENEPQYNQGMRVARKTTEGPIGAGTSFHAEMTGSGRVVPMTIRVTELERPRRIRERVEMQSMDITGGLDFEPIDDGTRMRWHWDLRPNGVLRFMGPLVASIGRRQERRIWTGLKRLLESRAVP